MFVSGSPGNVIPSSSNRSIPSCMLSSPSCCIPTKCTSPPPGGPYVWYASSNTGSSALHGGHDGNQKFMTSGLPWSVRVSKVPALNDCPANPGESPYPSNAVVSSGAVDDCDDSSSWLFDVV